MIAVKAGQIFKFLFPSHKILDFVVVADKEKDNFVGELKQDAVFQSGADFPVVAVPVFQAKARGQCSLPVQILYERVNGLINLLLTGRRKFLEAPVTAGFKLVSHVTSSGVLGVCEQQRSPRSGYPVPFLIDRV